MPFPDSIDRAVLAHFWGLALRESGHLVGPTRLDLDTDVATQTHCFSIALFELEHDLARDFVLDPEVIIHVERYIHERRINSGPVRYMSGPSQKTEQRMKATHPPF